MPARRLFTLLLILTTALFAFACSEDEITGALEDAAEDTFGGGGETALKEPELSNCSRVINCCAQIEAGDTPVTAQLKNQVGDECAAMGMGNIASNANGVVDEYQMRKMMIESNTSGQAQMTALEEWRSTAQSTVEPGCRCFLENTLGNLNDIVLPTDCEFIPDSGALPAGKMCSDMFTLLGSAASGGIEAANASNP